MSTADHRIGTLKARPQLAGDDAEHRADGLAPRLVQRIGWRGDADREVTAVAYNQLGQVYAKQGDAKAAADAYEQAAKALPANAGMYYFNEAVTLYNNGKLPEADAAADKAIAADPNKADAYYIKGQALIPQATVDPKTQKIVAPPGCIEAYQKYLELAPDGAHAADVKGILEGIGAQVKSSYKAGKK